MRELADWFLTQIKDNKFRLILLFPVLLFINFYFVANTANLIQNYLPDQMLENIGIAIPLVSLGFAIIGTFVIGATVGAKSYGYFVVIEAILLLLFALALILFPRVFPLDPKAQPVVTATPAFITPIAPSNLSPVPQPTVNFSQGLEQIPSLDSNQVALLTALVKERGKLLSLEDLSTIPLNPIQLSQVKNWLVSQKVITEDTLNIRLTEVANEQIAARQLTREATCFVKNESLYSSVAVRELPRKEDSAVKRYLLPEEQLLVVGHDGREINNDRWWQVELPATGTEKESDYGWIHSDFVEEINDSCYTLSRIGE